MEAELRRLQLELKQTMDMYSLACKEAVREKNKVFDAAPYLSMNIVLVLVSSLKIHALFYVLNHKLGHRYVFHKISPPHMSTLSLIGCDKLRLKPIDRNIGACKS